MTSDNGVQFVSEAMQYVAHCLGFKQHLIPVYHAESNPIERKNRDMKTQLSILVGQDHRTWKDKLPSIRFAMNTSQCDSTGFTPAYLTFGRELRTPDDVNRDLRAIIENENFIPEITPYLLDIANTLRTAKDNHEEQQDKTKFHADLKRRPTPTYELGDLVLVDSHPISKAKTSFTSKLAPKRDGPYRISRVVTPTTYEITTLGNPDDPIAKCHSSALTKYQPTQEAPQPIYPIRRRGRPPKTTSLTRNPNREPQLPTDSAPAPIDHVANPDTPDPLEDEARNLEMDRLPSYQSGRLRRQVRAPYCPCAPEHTKPSTPRLGAHTRTSVYSKRGDCNNQNLTSSRRPGNDASDHGEED